MGCTESILSAIAEKSTGRVKSNTIHAKVEPVPLRSDRTDRERARERRHRVIAERHAKAQYMAKVISDNAMAEKERLSSSTWISWRSGVSSDNVSPAVSISVRGSDGTASPDKLTSPAIDTDRVDERRVQDGEDTRANNMQIGTFELPNQVADEPVSGRECGSHSSNNVAQRSGDVLREMGQTVLRDEGALESGKDHRSDHSDEESPMSSRKTTEAHEESNQIADDMKWKGNHGETAVEEGVVKGKKQRKEVKFQVSDPKDGSLKKGRKETSQGR